MSATRICILCPLGIGVVQLRTTRDCVWVVVLVPPTGLMARIRVASGSALVMLRYLCYVCIICETVNIYLKINVSKVTTLVLYTYAFCSSFSIFKLEK